jgi:hypothetical protein
MNRRKFLSTIGVAGAAAAAETSLSGAETNLQTVAVSSPRDGAPALYALTETGATAVWTLNVPARGWVEYGENRELGLACRSDSFGFVPHSERVIKVRLRGLKPGTVYWWRCVTAPLAGGEPQVSPVYSFRTLSAAAEETRFAVWNDTHDRVETIRKLHALTLSQPTDFLVWNGDISNNIEKPEVIPGLYVHPLGANLSEGPPVLFARGNHDVRGRWANQVVDYVDFPGGRSFYAFRSGPLAAIVLDTGEDKPDNHPTFHGVAAFEPMIREQQQWLTQVIREPALKSAPFRLAFCHLPLRWKVEREVDYDKGGFDWFSRRGRDAWQAALVEWGIHAIVSGHMHSWACLPATAEQPYEQIVGGGPELNSATLIRGAITRQAMKISIHSLDGQVAHESVYQPRPV